MIRAGGEKFVGFGKKGTLYYDKVWPRVPTTRVKGLSLISTAPIYKVRPPLGFKGLALINTAPIYTVRQPLGFKGLDF